MKDPGHGAASRFLLLSLVVVIFKCPVADARILAFIWFFFNTGLFAAFDVEVLTVLRRYPSLKLKSTARQRDEKRQSFLDGFICRSMTSIPVLDVQKTVLVEMIPVALCFLMRNTCHFGVETKKASDCFMVQHLQVS